MRLVAFSFGAFAASAIGLMAMFAYALNVPTRAAMIAPPAIETSVKPQQPIAPAGPEKWASTNLRSVLK